MKQTDSQDVTPFDWVVVAGRIPRHLCLQETSDADETEGVVAPGVSETQKPYGCFQMQQSDTNVSHSIKM